MKICRLIGVARAMTDVFVGTSGWMYDWNPLGTLDWYIKHSGLNAVELNMSFYRYPFPSQVKSWARKGSGLRWAVKIHRLITHYSKLSGKALEYWKKFYGLFSPLDKHIDFYLLQLPPSYVMSSTNLRKLVGFIRNTGVERKIAVEFRDVSWYNNLEVLESISSTGAIVVSIDSPQGTWVTASNDIVYLRMHGRTDWYFHDYSYKELEDITHKIAEANPQSVYVFFNNNHWMLENARLMLRILRELL